MDSVSTFSEFDSFVVSAREYFRKHAKQKQDEVEDTFDLCFSFFKSIGKSRNPKEWKNSREEDVIKILTKALQVVFGMYYLSESGYYNLALSLKRNFTELLLVAIAIGYDQLSHIDWKNDRDDFRDVHKIGKKLLSCSRIPQPEKELIPILLKYWDESSQLHSHQVTKKAVEEGIRINDGGITLGSHIVKEEFQIKRLNTLRNMALNMTTILLGVFDYGNLAQSNKPMFPEALGLIAKYNNLQRTELKSQPTI